MRRYTSCLEMPSSLPCRGTALYASGAAGLQGARPDSYTVAMLREGQA